MALILLLTLLLSRNVFAAHTYPAGNQSYISKDTGSPITKAYTCPAGVTVLVVAFGVTGVTARAGGPLTYNGIEMTQVESTATSAEGWAELWYLLAPPTESSLNVVIPNTGQESISAALSSYISDSGYSYLSTSSISNTNVSANPSLNAPAPAIDGAVIVDAMYNGYHLAASGGRTEVYALDMGSDNMGSQYYLQATAAEAAMSWTQVSDDWCMITASFVSYGSNWCEHVNAKGCFLMEDDGNETDEAKGNTLTETSGDIPQDADRKFGTYSRDFERGDTEYLTHADSLSTDISGADQSISITGWIKRESETAAQQWIVAKYAGTDNQRQYLLYTDTAEQVSCGFSSDGTSGNTSWATTPNSVIANGTWVHLACVYNDTDIRIYIDGSLASNGGSNPAAHTAGIANKTSAFTVGANSPSSNSYFDGLMDDVGIFDVALSSTDINDIMDNGLLQEEATAGRTRRVFLTN